MSGPLVLALLAVVVVTAIHFRWPQLPVKLAYKLGCGTPARQRLFVAIYWIVLPVVLYVLMQSGFRM